MLVINMLKKFDNDASSRFCWSDKNSREVEKKKKKTHGNQTNYKIDRE